MARHANNKRRKRWQDVLRVSKPLLQIARDEDKKSDLLKCLREISKRDGDAAFAIARHLIRAVDDRHCQQLYNQYNIDKLITAVRQLKNVEKILTSKHILCEEHAHSLGIAEEDMERWIKMIEFPSSEKQLSEYRQWLSAILVTLEQNIEGLKIVRKGSSSGKSFTPSGSGLAENLLAIYLTLKYVLNYTDKEARIDMAHMCHSLDLIHAKKPSPDAVRKRISELNKLYEQKKIKIWSEYIMRHNW